MATKNDRIETEEKKCTNFKSDEWLKSLNEADEVELIDLKKRALMTVSIGGSSGGSNPSFLQRLSTLFSPHPRQSARDSYNTPSFALRWAGADGRASLASRSSEVLDGSFLPPQYESLDLNLNSYVEDEAYADTFADLLLPPASIRQAEYWTKVEEGCELIYHNFYYQSFQIALALISGALYIYQTYGYYDDMNWGLSWQASVMYTTVTGVFLGDYLIGVISAKEKWRHICMWTSVFDLLSIMPGILSLISDRPFLEFLMLLRLVRASYILKLHWLTNVAESNHKRASFEQEHNYYALTAFEQTLDFTRNALSLGLTIICLVFIATGVVFYLQVVSNEAAFLDDQADDQHLYYHEALYYVIITLATVGYGDIRPVSRAARMVMAFFVVLFLTFVPYFSIELVKSVDSYSQYLGRYRKTKGVKHILLTGTMTFETVDTFMTEILELEEFKNFKVVILSPHEPDFKLLALLRSSKFLGHTVYLKGSPLNYSDLDRAAANSAFAIILLTKKVYKKPKQEDLKLLYQAMSVSSYLGQPSLLNLTAGMFTWPQVVLRVNRPQSISQVHALGMGNAISRDLVKIACFSKSILHPGLSLLVSSLIKPPEISKTALLDAPWYAEYFRGISKQIYTVRFPEIFNGKRFSEVVQKAYTVFEIIVIAVESFESGRVLLNPGPQYEIEDGDKAFVIAYSKGNAQELEHYNKSFKAKSRESLASASTATPEMNYVLSARRKQREGSEKNYVRRREAPTYGTGDDDGVAEFPQLSTLNEICRKPETIYSSQNTIDHCRRVLYWKDWTKAHTTATKSPKTRSTSPPSRSTPASLNNALRSTEHELMEESKISKCEVNSKEPGRSPMIPAPDLQINDIEEMSGNDLRILLQSVKDHSSKANYHMDGNDEEVAAISQLQQFDIPRVSAVDARKLSLQVLGWLNKNKGCFNSVYKSFCVPGPEERNESEFFLHSTNSLTNHVLVIGMPCAPTYIELFLQPLMGIVPVVFLVRFKEQQPMQSALEEVKLGGRLDLRDVHCVVGSPASQRRLLRAGVDRCASLVIFNSRGTHAQNKPYKEHKEHPDASTLLCYLKARTLIQKSCHLTVELVDSMSLRSLRACDGYHHPIIHRVNYTQLPWPFFAAGKVYTSCFLEMLLAKAVFNPSLMVLVDQLLGIASHNDHKPVSMDEMRSSLASTATSIQSERQEARFSSGKVTDKHLRLARDSILLHDQTLHSNSLVISSLISMNIPKAFYQHSFGELFQELAAPPLHIIAIGLYRARGTKESTQPYVYTAPRADTVLQKTDKVFVLANVTTGASSSP